MSSKEQPDGSVQSPKQLAYTFTLPFVVLLSLTCVTQLASLAYTTEQSFSSVFLRSLVALMVITTPLIILGLRLGAKIGLGAPLLVDLISRRPGAGRQLVSDAALATTLGVVIGAFLWVLRIATESYLPPELPALGHRGVVGGLLVSVSAAIGEEIWLRLGVMTMLVWLLQRLLGHSQLTPTVVWTAIALAALVFGLIHLPQLAASGAANSIGIVATIIGNTLVGMVCGWVFWKRGLIAAIFAHFAIDMVLHVLPALLA